MSLQMKGLVHFYHPPVILFERGKKYCRAAILWKGTNWKFIFLWRKINWYGLQIAKRHFSYTIWLISEKSIIVYTFLHHDDDMRTCTKSLGKQGIQKSCLLEFPIALTHIYIQKEGISKHFGKKITICLIEVVTCLVRVLNMELNMILIVLMDFACITIRQSVSL